MSTAYTEANYENSIVALFTATLDDLVRPEGR